MELRTSGTCLFFSNIYYIPRNLHTHTKCLLLYCAMNLAHSQIICLGYVPQNLRATNLLKIGQILLHRLGIFF
jgi:hypothetical protein